MNVKVMSAITNAGCGLRHHGHYISVDDTPVHLAETWGGDRLLLKTRALPAQREAAIRRQRNRVALQ